EPSLLAARRRVVDAVAHEQERRAGIAARERGHAEPDLVVTPRDGGNRQVAVLERLRALAVVPGDEVAAQPDERLDREAAAVELEHALLVHEGFLVVAVGPDDGPVRLLAREVLREEPGRFLARDVLEELVRRRRERDRLHAQ